MRGSTPEGLSKGTLHRHDVLEPDRGSDRLQDYEIAQRRRRSVSQGRDMARDEAMILSRLRRLFRWIVEKWRPEYGPRAIRCEDPDWRRLRGMKSQGGNP